MNNCQFKFKPDKIKYLSNIDTLDSTHKKTIEGINKKRDDVPKKTKRLDKLKNDLEDLDRTNLVDNVNYISQRSKLIEEIARLEEEISQVENYEDEIDYYSKTYDILFNYYDIIDAINPLDIEESKKNIIEELKNATSSENIIVDNTPNNNFINNFINSTDDNFNTSENLNLNDSENPFANSVNITDSELKSDLKEPNANSFSIDGVDIFNTKSSKLDLLNQLSKMKRKEKKTTRKRVKNVESLIKDNNNIFDYIESNKINVNSNNIGKTRNRSYSEEDKNIVKHDRATLYEDYKVMLEGYISKKKNTKPCISCGIDKVLIYSEGIYACMKCGEVENCIVESEITNYKDPMIEKPTFPYKRKNHFCEWNFILNCSLEWILKRFANVNYLV
jgi:hypothetical protein